jgi:hypothetical protein
MHHKLIPALALTATVVAPALAHEGHTHKILGTVASVQGTRVEVKTTDGKAITVMLDAKTTVTRGKVKLDAAALKVGERVSVDYTEQKNVNTAKTIKLGETPAAAKK